MPLKRTNWTTEEVIELIEGQKLVTVEGADPADDYCRHHNDALSALACHFRDFLTPETEMGALAYNTDDKMTYHIGRVPPR